MTEYPSILETAAALNCLPTKQAGGKLVSGNCPTGHGSNGNRCYFIYPDTNSWYCFHCASGGSSYDLIMASLKCDFKEATAWAKSKRLISGEVPQDDKGRSVFKLLTAVARFFNNHLDSIYREYLEAHYGLTADTINQYSIGYAPLKNELLQFLSKNFEKEVIEQSGLVTHGKPFFQGQIIFPYWKDGLVRYMIGRQTTDNQKKAKYEKLKTTDIVKNDIFYGEDSIKDCREIYLTEGVTDCLAALQYKLPSISPVTTQFRKADHPKLLSMSKGKTVYIIPDNEENNAGMDGAAATLQFLTEHGISAFILTLPRPDGSEKIDFNEYVRDHGISAFLSLRDEQVKTANLGAMEGIIAEAKEWTDLQDGVFTISELYRELGLNNHQAKFQRRALLKELITNETIRRIPDRPGIYTRVNHNINKIDWMNADPSNIYPVLWPFNIQHYVHLFPKNIAVVAGASNAGKTALLLNLAKTNCHRHKVRYLSSEMGPEELKSRIKLFNFPLQDWQAIDFYDRSVDFSPLIDPYGFNIIDYLEISDNFFTIGAEIKQIYDKLITGIAVIAIQKKSDAVFARGGEFTLEKARLYITVDPGVVKIIKGKNWATAKNPKGMEFHYKLIDGCKFLEIK